MNAPAIMVEALPVERLIVLRLASAGFEVAVEPYVDGDPAPTVHPTLAEARGFAGGMRLSKGWPIESRLP